MTGSVKCSLITGPLEWLSLGGVDDQALLRNLVRNPFLVSSEMGPISLLSRHTLILGFVIRGPYYGTVGLEGNLTRSPTGSQ